MFKIISGSNGRQLAQDLSQSLNLEYVEALIERFSDQELRVRLPSPCYNQEVIIVQSTSKPANDHLMELLLLVDAVKRSGAKKVIALIPYFGYSRQDRPSYEWGPISARLVASLLEAAGVDYLITLDLHSKQSEGFFKIGIQNIDPLFLFTPHIKKIPNLIVISPDIGGVIRARKLSEYLDCALCIINKSRKTLDLIKTDNILGEIKDKHCIIIDDIVDTGFTLCKAAFLLKASGARSVQVIVTHCVLSGEAALNLEQAPIEKIITTNSIVQKTLPAKFYTLDIVPILAEAIKRILRF